MDLLKIMDYKGSLFDTGIDLDKIDDITIISVETVSGDEIIRVNYKDKAPERYDAGFMGDNFRYEHFHDGEYTLYSIYDGTNLIDKFKKRKSTYWFWEQD